jgi:hypothetical protein
MRATCLILTLLTFTLLAGCGRSSRDDSASTPLQSGPGVFSLPAPSTLPRTASGPPTDYSRLMGAGNEAFLWPQNRVTSDIFTMFFSPAWNPDAPSLADAAYASYCFTQFAGYDGTKRIRLLWDQFEPLPAQTDVYIGLANQASDSWDFFRVNGNYECYFTKPWADYIDPAENFCVVVMVLGQQYCELRYVLAGDTFVPDVSIKTNLNADPAQNIAPLTVDFEAVAGSVGSVITKYDWDFEADGTWDLLDQSSKLASHTYEPGLWTVRVRAHDGEGNSGIGEKTFTAVDPANQQPLALFTTSDSTSGPAPLAIDFDASVSSDNDGSIILYEWDFDGQQGWDYTSTDPTSSYVFGNKGNRDVILRVTDNDYATDTYSMSVFLTAGWVLQPLDNDVGMGTFSGVTIDYDIAEFGGLTPRIGVAYRDDKDNALKFLRSTGSSGDSWYGFTYPVPGVDSGYSCGLAQVVGGAPIIAHGRRDAANFVYSQHVVTATDATGATWGSEVDIMPGTNMGNDTSLLVINTLPALAAHTGHYSEPENTLVYVQAQDTDGTSWHPPATIMAPGSAIYSRVNLGVCGPSLFKRPAVVFAFGQGGGAEPRYAWADGIDGDNWPSLYTYNEQSYYNSLGWVNGRPAWIGGIPSSTGAGSLRYRRAYDALGSSWSPPQVIGSGGDGELVVWNGNPAVVFVDTGSKQVQLVTATDVDGTAWSAPFPVASRSGIESARCAIVDDALVVAYYNGLDEDLMLARWE